MRFTLTVLAVLATTALCADPIPVQITDQEVSNNVSMLDNKVKATILLAKDIKATCKCVPRKILFFTLPCSAEDYKPATTEDKWVPVIEALNGLVVMSDPLFEGLGNRTTPDFNQTLVDQEIYGYVTTLYGDLWTLFTAHFVVQSDSAAASQGAMLKPAMNAVTERFGTLGLRLTRLTSEESTVREFNKALDQSYMVMDLAMKLYTVPS
ncbi:hypothetical protein B0T14DRAFT_570858 [Immersiella caudata]|uniref:Uncharacterized protein n=1 Tax=Immersiella caudata TaxID=314043 RepID=A0AA39TH83_9PEZI|nr:hypothetical protein B0T14DRAFT_570858 [Immersiella caudata]